MIWIVGSNPRPKNVNPLVPFWGTTSYETLSKWLKVLGINRHALLNVSNEVTNDKKFIELELDRCKDWLKQNESY